MTYLNPGDAPLTPSFTSYRNYPIQDQSRRPTEIALMNLENQNPNNDHSIPDNSIISRIRATFALYTPSIFSSNNINPVRIKFPSDAQPKNSTVIQYEQHQAVSQVIDQIKIFLASIPPDLNYEFIDITTLEGRYLGKLEDSKPIGKGKIIVPLGEYEGELENGVPGGAGVLKTFCSTVKGQFLLGYPHGKCEATFIKRSLIIAKLAQGALNIDELKNTPHSDLYNGYYKNGKFNGHGSYTKNHQHPNKSVYVGEFKEDLRHGSGKVTYNSGNVFKGLWENNLRHGKGEFYFKDSKSTISGEWVNGKFLEPRHSFKLW